MGRQVDCVASEALLWLFSGYEYGHIHGFDHRAEGSIFFLQEVT